MSGLEVVAAVAGIISAFNGSVTIYRSWRDKKRERLENEKNKTLEQSLVSGSTTVQSEYDKHFTRLRRKFAVGDDRGRAELLEYMVKLQNIIITMMAESGSPVALVIPSLPLILSTSDETRMGVVSALGEQYQRMLQAKPLFAFNVFGSTRNKEKQSSRKQTSKMSKKLTVGLQERNRMQSVPAVDRRTNSNICSGSVSLKAGDYRYNFFTCSNCLEMPSLETSLLLTETENGTRFGIPQRKLLSWHIARTTPKTDEIYDSTMYGCKICFANKHFTLEELGTHTKLQHIVDELARVLGPENVQRCTCREDMKSESRYQDHEEDCEAQRRAALIVSQD